MTLLLYPRRHWLAVVPLHFHYCRDAFASSQNEIQLRTTWVDCFLYDSVYSRNWMRLQGNNVFFSLKSFNLEKENGFSFLCKRKTFSRLLLRQKALLTRRKRRVKRWNLLTDGCIHLRTFITFTYWGSVFNIKVFHVLNLSSCSQRLLLSWFKPVLLI